MPCCDQRFWVVDESGVGLTNALVKARKSVQTGFWEVTSDTTNGSAVLTLDQGDTYTVTVTKSGYTSTPTSKVFKPCIGTINFTLKESAMGTSKACIYLQDPSSSRNVNVGDYVTVRMGIENCGTERGNLYGIIHKSGTECVQNNGWFDPGEVLKLYGRECDIHNMPNSIVRITFYGGHAEGSSWIQDFSKTITLTPSPVTGSLHVSSSPTGASIYLSAYPYTSNVYKGTTPKTLTNLDATTYKVTCKKSGYEDQFKWATVIANSTVNVSFTLEPIVEYVNQPFRVVDATTGTGINSAWVEVVGVDKRITSTTGYVTFRLIKNKSYTSIATKSGYDSINKSFNASSSQITVRLPKIVTTGTLSVTSTPVQDADIYINDIKQSYKTNYNFTLEAGHYDVNVKLTGYKEPSLQGVTVVSDQTKTLTFTLEEEAPPPTCANLPPEECISPCYLWSDDTCHNIPEGIPTCSDYDNTSKEECEGHIGCYWWDVDSTCRNTSPDKIDTKLTWMEIPETAVVNKPVKISVALERATAGGLDIEGKIIRFYANDVEIGSATTIEEHIFVKAIAEIEYPFAESGFYDIIAKFEELDEEYNPSESEYRTIELKEPEPCDQGFRVTVKNIPESGLHVWCKKTAIAWWKKSVTPDEPTVVFDKQDGLSVGAVTYIQVLTYDDYILDETDNIKAPSSGCNEVSLNGWNGCKWRILLTGPSEVSLNKSFQIKSTLFEIPSNIISENKQVEFYETSLDTTPIWTDTTDEDGVALCTVPAKTTIGTYTYFAKYYDAPTFCEPLTGLNIKVVEKLGPEGIWESLIQFIIDTFGVEPERAKIIAYTGIGLVSLFFLSSLFKS